MRVKIFLQLCVLVGGCSIQAVELSEVPMYEELVTLDGGTLHGVAAFRGGIALAGPESQLSIDLMGVPLQDQLALHGGQIHLNADLHCGSRFSLSSSGKIDGQGHALLLDGDATVEGQIEITSSMTIDGRGHRLNFSEEGQLLVDPGVKLKLRNVTVDNAESVDFLLCLGEKSQVVLDNVEICLSDNFVFRQGELVIQKAQVHGKYAFIFASPQSSVIAEHGLLSVSDGARLHFASEALEVNRALLCGVDETSVLMLNSATLSSGSPGLIFSQGTLALDNNVILDIDGRTVETGMSLCATDNNDEATMKVLAAANITLKGYLKTDF